MVLRKQSDSQENPWATHDDVMQPTDGPVVRPVDTSELSNQDPHIPAGGAGVLLPLQHGSESRQDDVGAGFRVEESGSDWSDVDEQDIGANSQAPSQPTQQAVSESTTAVSAKDPLPPSLRPSPATPPGKVLGPGSNNTVLEDSSLGIGKLSLQGSPTAQSEPWKNNNPFLRRRTDDKIPVDTLDVETNVWKTEEGSSQVGVPRQFPLNQVARKPIPSSVSHDFASGQMAGSNEYINAQPTATSTSARGISDHIDDPWKDIDLLGSTPIPVEETEPSSSHTKLANETSRDVPRQESTASIQRHAPPLDTSIPVSPSSGVLSPGSLAKRQRNEVYQIKHIRWYDANSGKTARQSPILIQNANGPCPLLALVNTLLLSTPATTTTALVETLRTREQVSLGLLLDAVFDELMSGRRGETAQGLPDVGELYSFLITLHTGMNVNPRFVPRATETQTLSLIDLESHEPTPTGAPHAGGFEDTREMKLYSTFSIPLIHGWLPHEHDAAYSAFGRTAQSYEDAQNIQSQEEELDRKLQSGELTPGEKSLYMDLNIIKRFFSHWPTQLTSYGLDMINECLKPGQMAILFRNDHFSTLYKEPKTNQLMTLVTDAGYATHDEIVWESLVDINGSHSELFAGDFKSVSHSAPVAQETFQAFDETGGTNDIGRDSQPQRDNEQLPISSESGQNVVNEPSSSSYTSVADTGKSLSAAEQEDHDLALALQLQEEEEERQRNDDEERRRREEELSQQYLSRESSQQGPEIPPRRSNQAAQNIASSNRTSDGPPPPPYEQAASGREFRPQANSQGQLHPGAAASYYSASSSGGRRRPNARQSLVDQIPPAPSSRRAKANESNSGEDRCILM